MSKKIKSPLQQSLQLFKHGDAIGESRVTAKLDGTINRKIFHSTTFKEYVGNFTRLLEFTRREFHVHLVKDLTPEHVSAFFQSLNSRNLADSTIKKYEAVIQKADVIAKHIGWRPVDAQALIRPEPKGPRIRSEPTPYTGEEIEKIIKRLSGLRDRRFAAIAQLQRGAGLRVSEACGLTVFSVQPDGSQLNLTSKDQTKKGRPRAVSIFEPKTQEVLRNWRSTAVNSNRQRLFVTNAKHIPALVREYEKAVQWAAEQEGILHTKTHDIRRTFARERLDEYLAKGMTKKEAFQQLSADLGHGRSRMERGLLASYLAFDEE